MLIDPHVRLRFLSPVNSVVLLSLLGPLLPKQLVHACGMGCTPLCVHTRVHWIKQSLEDAGRTVWSVNNWLHLQGSAKAQDGNSPDKIG